jgi:hypothetical protein
MGSAVIDRRYRHAGLFAAVNLTAVFCHTPTVYYGRGRIHTEPKLYPPLQFYRPADRRIALLLYQKVSECGAEADINVYLGATHTKVDIPYLALKSAQ